MSNFLFFCVCVWNYWNFLGMFRELRLKTICWNYFRFLGILKSEVFEVFWSVETSGLEMKFWLSENNLWNSWLFLDQKKKILFKYICNRISTSPELQLQFYSQKPSPFEYAVLSHIAPAYIFLFPYIEFVWNHNLYLREYLIKLEQYRKD